MADAAASLQLLVRQPEQTSLWAGIPDVQECASFKGVPAKTAVPSADGTKLAAVTEEGVAVYETATGAKVVSLPVSGVTLVDWSKSGAYITTAQRPSKGADGQAVKNIKVFDAASGALVFEVGVKSVNKEAWPLLHWSAGDVSLFHGVTNTVHQYSRADGFKVAKKIPIKGVTTFQPCPADKPLIAAFIAESKGQPAVATVLDHSGEQPVTISRKSFYRATGAQIMWNAPSTACLFMATCETDATNQSYYGESKLHYLPAEADRGDAACSVALPKDGPVHDVQWSPAGDFFVVVAGFMPAKVILHDFKCKPVFDLGSGPYNVARWNPFGRFLAIAGFGNLPGDIVFFNKLAKGNCKQMGATRSGSSVTAAWSPCGRYFLTATTAPRLRVDNNMRVFNYVGEKLCEKPFEILLEASWMPANPTTTQFEDRPPSPERLARAGASANGAAGGGAAGGAAAGGQAKAAYRPPAMRTLQQHLVEGAAASGSSSSSSSGPKFSLAYDSSSRPGRITNQGGKQLPPGADFVSKAASKNAKKRANKKAKAGGGEGDGDDGEDEQQQQQPAAGGSSKQAAAVEAVTQQMAAAGVGGADAADGDAAQKRVRALQKKLRQIQQLKDKRDKEGVALEPEQIQKIKAEAEVIAEIKSLGGTV